MCEKVWDIAPCGWALAPSQRFVGFRHDFSTWICSDSRITLKLLAFVCCFHGLLSRLNWTPIRGIFVWVLVCIWCFSRHLLDEAGPPPDEGDPWIRQQESIIFL